MSLFVDFVRNLSLGTWRSYPGVNWLYPFNFLLPLFREIRYSDIKKWLYKKPKNKSSFGRTIVFKTTFNCSHARIKSVISTILPELDCAVCYKKTATLANICK